MPRSHSDSDADDEAEQDARLALAERNSAANQGDAVPPHHRLASPIVTSKYKDRSGLPPEETRFERDGFPVMLRDGLTPEQVAEVVGQRTNSSRGPVMVSNFQSPEELLQQTRDELNPDYEEGPPRARTRTALEPARTILKKSGFKEPGWKSASAVKKSKEWMHDIIKNAEDRWLGMPFTKQEKEADETLNWDKLLGDWLRDHYGFVGHAIVQSSSGAHQTPRVMTATVLFFYGLFFFLGSVDMAYWMMEFMVFLLPLQNTLSTIRGLKQDFKRRKGEDWNSDGANVNQRLIYWTFYVTTSMLLGWVYASRPSCYRTALAVRTGILFACMSPFFGDFNLDFELKKKKRDMIMKEIWLERGLARRLNSILHAAPASFKREKKTKRDKFTFTDSERVAFWDLEARKCMNFLYHFMKCIDEQEGWRDSEKREVKQKAQSALERLEDAYYKDFEPLKHKFKKAGVGGAVIPHTWSNSGRVPKIDFDPVDKAKFNSVIGEKGGLPYAIAKVTVMMRKDFGQEVTADYLRHKYQATEEEISKYIAAQNEESGYIRGLPQQAQVPKNMDLLLWHSRCIQLGHDEPETSLWSKDPEVRKASRARRMLTNYDMGTQDSHMPEGAQVRPDATYFERMEKIDEMKERGQGEELQSRNFDWLTQAQKDEIGDYVWDPFGDTKERTIEPKPRPLAEEKQMIKDALFALNHLRNWKFEDGQRGLFLRDYVPVRWGAEPWECLKWYADIHPNYMLIREKIKRLRPKHQARILHWLQGFRDEGTFKDWIYGGHDDLIPDQFDRVYRNVEAQLNKIF